MRAICGHSQCKDYCIVQFYYEQHCKINDVLNLVGSKYKAWKAIKDCNHNEYACCLPEQATFQFCGVSLQLNSDGTYYLSDTTGG